MRKQSVKINRGNFGRRVPEVFELFNDDGTPFAFNSLVADIQLVSGDAVQRLLTSAGLYFDLNGAIVWVPTENEVEALSDGANDYYIEILYTDGSGYRAVEGSITVTGVPMAAELKSTLEPPAVLPPAQPSNIYAQTFALNAVSSFTAVHGLSYNPTYTLVDSGGVAADTDAQYSPGALHLTFASPFTGTLTLY